MSHLVLLIVLIVSWISTSTILTTEEACTDSSKCHFMCHCQQRCYSDDGVCPPTTGCMKGWFGLRCQYQDLMTVSDANVTVTPYSQQRLLTDNDDETCTTDVTCVTVTWTRQYPITWIRLVVRDTSDVTYIKLLYNKTTSGSISGDIFPCQSQMLYHVNNRTIDLRCMDNVTTSTLQVKGNYRGLCSIYISGGHNLAYKQTSELSSIYKHITPTPNGGDRAVDGNNDPNYYNGSCAHSGLNETLPSLTVTLQQPAVIHRVLLYNRDEYQNRLKSFRLEMFNNADQKILESQDTSSVFQEVYNLNVNASHVKSIIVIATAKAYDIDINPILTLCELEAYGECLQGKWGLTCSNECPEKCKTSCHIDDGSCSEPSTVTSDTNYCDTDLSYAIILSADNLITVAYKLWQRILHLQTVGLMNIIFTVRQTTWDDGGTMVQKSDVQKPVVQKPDSCGAWTWDI